MQKSSREPVVQLNDLEARLQMDNGGALVTAQRGSYDLGKEQVTVDGPIRFESANGYRMVTRDVDHRAQQPHPAQPRPGRGTHPDRHVQRPDHLTADLEKRTVSLDGRAR